MVAWGDNYYGQTNTPADLTNVVSIAAGGFHGLALKADGTVEGWGASGFDVDFGQEDAPTDLTNAVSVAGGYFHSLALKSDGTVRQWGDTAQGQSNPPTNLKRALAIAGGYAHSYALVDDTPVILNQPTNMVTVTNKAASFVVNASGGTPMRATWFSQVYTNGSYTNVSLVSVNYSNVNTSATAAYGNTASASLTNSAVWGTNLQFSLSTTNSPGNRNYFVVLTNVVGAATSSVATLTVLTPPVITNQPVNIATNLGATVFFTVGASGSPPLSYQWFFNGTNNPVWRELERAGAG